LSYANKLAAIFKNNLSVLNEQELLQVVAMLDLFKSPWKMWLNQALSKDNWYVGLDH
jgi:hypothetical protein